MGRVELLCGDCLALLPTLAEGSVDAVVTDPPYGLEFMGKEWDRLDYDLPQEQVWKGRRGKGGSKEGSSDERWTGEQGRSIPSGRTSFGGKRSGAKRCRKCGKRQFSGTPCSCDEPDWEIVYPEGPPSGMVRMQRWHQQWATAVLRVLKPAGYLLCFGGTRTYHRLACAVEDAGFEVRDCLMWLHSQGFPKGKGCLKPAWEPILLCRKPGKKVLPLGIDECRVGTECTLSPRNQQRGPHWSGEYNGDGPRVNGSPAGRWPANVVISDDAEVLEAFAAFGNCGSPFIVRRSRRKKPQLGVNTYGRNEGTGPGEIAGYGDTGTAARFFYCAKASRRERNAGLEGMPERDKHIYGEGIVSADHPGIGDGGGNRPSANHHPCVKPLALMTWLVKLACPPGGLCLDPFAGSGTTGVACLQTGREFLGIERDASYVQIAQARLTAAAAEAARKQPGDLFSCLEG
jgi:site-specific DNA-methyltransferase (adenine-specific)